MAIERFFIAITGPTAAGKSDYAERLADRINGEIVNADMGQLYKPLTIGTAKPSWQTATIPHHLFDIVEEPLNFSVAEFRKKVIATFETIWSRKRIPLIVGGSGFYIRSLFFPPQEQTYVDTKNEHYTHVSTEILWNKLLSIDPARAHQIHRADRYRIQRALNVWEQQKVLPSHLKPLYAPIAPFILLWITRERQELYDRINKRVEIMFRQGWLNEVKELPDEWYPFLRVKKIIGYNDIVDFIEKYSEVKEPSTELSTRIAQKTRQYAKRQMIFWKSFKKDMEIALNPSLGCGIIQEVNLTFSPLDLYINETQAMIGDLLSCIQNMTHE